MTDHLAALAAANAAADAAARAYRDRKAQLAAAGQDKARIRIAVRDDLDIADYRSAWAFHSQEAVRAALTILALTAARKEDGR